MEQKLSLATKFENWFYNTFEVKKKEAVKMLVGRTRLYADVRALMKGQFEGGNFDMTGLDGSIRKIVGPVQKSFFYAVNPGIGGLASPSKETPSLYSVLLSLRFIPVWFPKAFKTVHCPKCQQSYQILQKRQVREAMATQMLTEAAEVSHVVILGGDSEYVMAAKVLRELGVKVTVFAWKNAVASEFSRIAAVHYLDDLVVRKGNAVIATNKSLSAA